MSQSIFSGSFPKKDILENIKINIFFQRGNGRLIVCKFKIQERG